MLKLWFRGNTHQMVTQHLFYANLLSIWEKQYAGEYTTFVCILRIAYQFFLHPLWLKYLQYRLVYIRSSYEGPISDIEHVSLLPLFRCIAVHSSIPYHERVIFQWYFCGHTYPFDLLLYLWCNWETKTNIHGLHGTSHIHIWFDNSHIKPHSSCTLVIICRI